MGNPTGVGTSPANLTPVKSLPLWQAAPCPAWCVETHHDADTPAERLHFSHSQEVPLTLEKAQEVTGNPSGPRAAWMPPRLLPALLQHVREVEPVVEFHDDRDEYTVKMTLAEAEQLGRALLALVEQGRNGGAA